MGTSVLNDTWRDHTPETGYPVTTVVGRRRVAPVGPVAPQSRGRMVARILADTGAIVCFVGAAAWVVLSLAPVG
jgi:hypothetical protein